MRSLAVQPRCSLHLNSYLLIHLPSYLASCAPPSKIATTNTDVGVQQHISSAHGTLPAPVDDHRVVGPGLRPPPALAWRQPKLKGLIACQRILDESSMSGLT